MAILHSIEINNFRGIKTFKQEFHSDNLICLIGRGDSGKTTILEAISYVLSPNWNINFYDNDFYNCNVENPIEIWATIIDLPEFFLKEKYGLHTRGFNSEDGKIEDEILDDHEPAITIKLSVDRNLEPTWTIVNNRNEPISISASARSKLNSFLISDYTDHHFSWSKGGPLYTLLRQAEDSVFGEDKNVIIDALREAKIKIDNNSFQDFKNVTNQVKETSRKFGVKIPNTGTTIDFKDISKSNRVCLHEDSVPFRLKGKGSKRLISMSIQSIVADMGGIVLIDEIEQGLEPDRVKHLVRNFEKNRTGQIFFTTHSQNVIEELESSNIIIISNEGGECSSTKCTNEFQDIVRACPEAMYAQKVIVCEGKTELGICRTIDNHRIKKGLASLTELGVVYALGEGDNFTIRAKKLFQLNKDVCVFCDSDKDGELNPSKETIKKIGISIFDCMSGNSIEQQFFKDLPWEGVRSLVSYAIDEKGSNNIKQVVQSKLGKRLPNDWLDNDSSDIREALGLASKDKWYKRIDHGEFLGSIFFKYLSDMEDAPLKIQLENLSKWVEDE